MSSGDTRLDWRYVVDQRELATGQLTWPGCGWENLENNYAVEILQVAEEQFRPGCPRSLPQKESGLASLSANSLDTDQLSLQGAQLELERAWRELLGRRCARRAVPDQK